VKPFSEALAAGPLLLDGAMGSLLYERGVLHTRSYDELNISQPELIEAVHRDYVHAGAEIVETNTFGANRMALARHGLVEQAGEINRRGVALARSAAGDRAYVAGAVGPTGAKFGIATASERKLARFALAEQIDTLVLAGVDAIVLETFTSILEMETAIAVAKERGPRVPVAAMMVFDAQGKSDGGLGPAEIADRLIAAGADVVGGNCGIGPAELYQVAVGMVGRGRPVIAQPNAGLPASVEGRTLYVANPEHFGVFARRMLKSGVRVVGGCCGTTPEHTRSMLGAVRMLRGEKLDERGPRPAAIEITSKQPAPPAKTPLAERSRMGGRIARGEFVVSVELTAPPSSDLTKTKQQVNELLAAGADIVNIADGPRASARMANIAVCARLAAETKVEPILHVCARDKSFLGQVAHLLGAHALGLKNLVIITGDPPKMGDFPDATRGLRPRLDRASCASRRGSTGASTRQASRCGCRPPSPAPPAPSPRALNYERELAAPRAEEARRCRAGDDPAGLRSTRSSSASSTTPPPSELPVLVGLLPLASHRNAEFLHNEVPGMQIPEASTASAWRRSARVRWRVPRASRSRAKRSRRSSTGSKVRT
jgi:methionine synthase I (cobalamin-dependent)